MSTTKTAARRIALLSGSSLGLAAIASAASLGAALMPTAVLAQSVTCAATTAMTGNGTAAVTIAGGTNNPGILCNYTGDGATVSTLNFITVSSSGGVPADPLVNGVNLRATGADDIAWVSTAGDVFGGSQTNGPVIDARSSTGNISLTTAGVSVNSSAGADGIYAQTGGAGTVTLDLRGAVSGRGATGAALRVINGTGLVSIDIGPSGILRGVGTGSGGMVIDSDGAIVVESAGLIMGAYNATGSRPAAITASGATLALTFNGNMSVAADDVRFFRAGLGGSFVGGGFASPLVPGTIDNDAQRQSAHVGGHVDLTGLAGGAELGFINRSRWMVTEASVMSPGNDTVSFDTTSILMTAYSITGAVYENGVYVGELPEADADQIYIQPGIINFGAGTDIFNNDGRLLIGPAMTPGTGVGASPDLPPQRGYRYGIRGELRLLNLEQFNNSGAIWLGPNFFAGNELVGTDRWHDDMLYMPGATFHGEEGSVIHMDVELNNAQTSCAPSTRDAQGYLPAADCVGLQGGAATGRTELRIAELIPGDRGPYNPDGIVLIDLAGGDPDDTDPNAFFIGPNTPRYADVGDNGGIDKGVFVYALGFDAEDQQFKLYGIPSSGSQQFPILATAANQLWQTATGGWFDRRVHQRDVELGEGLGTGAWFNITGAGIERGISTTVALGTGEAEFDNSYEQGDLAISFGWDLLDHGSDAALGLMVGYARSQIEFEDSANSADLEGIHAGIYGGYAIGGFFIDGAVNGTMLVLDNDVPAMTLIPTGTVLSTDLRSLGGRVEAGWRWDTGYGLSIEPLVGFSAVRTDFEDMRIPNDDPDVNRPGVTVKLDAAESRRASAGLRVGLDDLWADTAPTSLSLTARAVNEFEGGANVSVGNVGPTYLSTDTLDGMFTQVTASVGVSNNARTISGYLNVDAVTGDDYESLGASLGVRLHW